MTVPELERLEYRLNEIGHSATLIPGIDGTKKPRDSGWRTLPTGSKNVNDCTLLLTGEQSGVFVIDLDNDEAIVEFERRFNPPETFTVRTRRGCHLYFQLPDFAVKTKAKLLIDGKKISGLDSRGWGGYVVAPGFAGKEIVIDAPIAEAPTSLLELPDLRRGHHQFVETSDPPLVEPATGKSLSRGINFAIEHASEVEPCIEGGGQDWIFEVCKFLGVDCLLDIETAWEVFDEHYNPKCFAADGVTEYRWERSQSDVPEQDASCFDRHFYRAVRSDHARASAFCRSMSKKLASKDHVPEPEEVIATPASVTPEGEVIEAVFEDACTRPNGETARMSLGNLIADLRCHRMWRPDVGDPVLRYDDLHKWITAKNGPIRLDAHRGNISSVDFTKIRAWFERNGHKVSKEDVQDAVELVAKETRYNPILDYLDNLPKVPLEELTDPGQALNCLAFRALGNNNPLAQDVLTKTLIASVRRMRRPGTKVDTVLVLRGKQSKRKSTFLVSLFGEAYVKSQMADLSSKDASVGLRGMWAIELAELDRVLRSEPSTFKEFISRPIDSYRPPYGKTEEQFPRQCVFFGTTNDDRFLVDATGNRRFWVIEVLSYDLRWLRAHRDEIWAAANALEAAGVPHWFEDENDARGLQEAYEVYDEWDELVQDFCAGRTMIKSASEFYVQVIAKGDPGALAKIDRRVSNRIWDIFRRFGLERRKAGGKCWVSVPEWLTKTEPSPEEASRRANSKAAASLAHGLKPSLVKP